MRRVIAGAIAVVVAIAMIAFFARWIQKWLWMRELGYTGIFWTPFSLRWELSCAAFVVVSLYIWINLRLAARNGGVFRVGGLASESATKLGIRSPQRFQTGRGCRCNGGGGARG